MGSEYEEHRNHLGIIIMKKFIKRFKSWSLPTRLSLILTALGIVVGLLLGGNYFTQLFHFGSGDNVAGDKNVYNESDVLFSDTQTLEIQLPYPFDDSFTTLNIDNVFSLIFTIDNDAGEDYVELTLNATSLKVEDVSGLDGDKIKNPEIRLIVDTVQKMPIPEEITQEFKNPKVSHIVQFYSGDGYYRFDLKEYQTHNISASNRFFDVTLTNSNVKADERGNPIYLYTFKINEVSKN